MLGDRPATAGGGAATLAVGASPLPSNAADASARRCSDSISGESRVGIVAAVMPSETDTDVGAKGDTIGEIAVGMLGVVMVTRLEGVLIAVLLSVSIPALGNESAIVAPPLVLADGMDSCACTGTFSRTCVATFGAALSVLVDAAACRDPLERPCEDPDGRLLPQPLLGLLSFLPAPPMLKIFSMLLRRGCASSTASGMVASEEEAVSVPTESELMSPAIRASVAAADVLSDRAVEEVESAECCRLGALGATVAKIRSESCAAEIDPVECCRSGALGTGVGTLHTDPCI